MIEQVNDENVELDIDNLVFTRLKSVSSESYSGPVFDLEVNDTANYKTRLGFVHNGGGRRKGSFAMYLAPHHPDIFDFLSLRKNNGKEEQRARDLNLALWTPDLFFRRLEANENWTLMDPNHCPGLEDVWGTEFDQLYESYEAKGMGERTLPARELWTAIVEAQIETGQPYILAKDACNKKSNQQNIGVIKSSNLCAEIIEFSDKDHTAVCNLVSVSLPACIDVGARGKKSFNFERLISVVNTLTENLNKVIDVEFYPTEPARRSNSRDRPIGIGIQGLADVFAQLKLAWDSPEALALNTQIAETMYWSAMNTSCRLASEFGPYETYEGSPVSKGILQPDMWGVTPGDTLDWLGLRKRIAKHGIRNSLLIASPPTASTSQILGNTECFEPITSNIYKRNTLSGEFIQVNRYLVEELLELGLWDDIMRQRIVAAAGSVQGLSELPDELRSRYRTVWELSQKVIINMAAARGPYVCQSQSMNLYIKDATTAKISSALMYAWKAGLKTLVYYLRTNAPKEATKITVAVNLTTKQPVSPKLLLETAPAVDVAPELIPATDEGIACSLDDPDSCVMCGS